jgi:hypothetical protein
MQRRTAIKVVLGAGGTVIAGAVRFPISGFLDGSLTRRSVEFN